MARGPAVITPGGGGQVLAPENPAFAGPLPDEQLMLHHLNLLKEKQERDEANRAAEQLAIQEEQTARALAQNDAASEIEGNTVAEWLARPNQAPVNEADMLAMENEYRSRGLQPPTPQRIYTPLPQGDINPPARQIQEPYHYYEPLPVPPELRIAGKSPPGLLRTMQGDLFRIQDVRGVEISAGTSVAGSESSKHVIVSTNAGSRVVAHAINNVPAAEWYRDQIGLMMAGEITTIPDLPDELRGA